MRPIEANTPLTFQIPSQEIKKGYEKNKAILRLGLGRDHHLSLQPSLLLNGQKIKVPHSNLTIPGQPQSDRPNFFGVLEISLPLTSLKSRNEVSITFPDQGGHISSLTLQTLIIE